MKILYIGHYGLGSTSRMRAECLQRLLQPSEFIIADIEVPMSSVSRLFKTIGWRYKTGPMISRINEHIDKVIGGRSQFDLVWIDKGVFVEPDMAKRLRACCKVFVHFTPDPAFLFHASRLFRASIKFFDYCITTKSFEVELYHKQGARNVLLCTQGYDPRVHKRYVSFDEKKAVSFIGHREDDREAAVAALLEIRVPVRIAGLYWEKFVSRNRHKTYFEYLGKGIYGADYAKLISGSLLSMGFLSKIIPEKHTTRTFEIPACHTALVTERTGEIESFYKNDEVLFYDDIPEMCGKVRYALSNPEWLKEVTSKGYTKVTTNGYDYESIMRNLLQRMEILP